MGAEIPERPEAGHRLLVIGDSHGHAGMLGRACALAARLGADEIWSVGDFGIWPGRSGRGFLDSVQYDASRAGITVRVVPGNHDDYDQIGSALEEGGDWGRMRENILVARRGIVHHIDDSRIMCLSGAASIDGPGGIWAQARGPGDGWWPQERISDEDVAEAKENIDRAGGKVDLMICHDLPDSAGVVGQSDFPLGEEIRGRIRQVAEHGATPVLIAGHWHRHLDRNVQGRREIILSADVNPSQRQWAVVDITSGSPDVTVTLPSEWTEAQALS